MKEKQIKIAEEFNIIEKIKKLESDLLQVKGVLNVEFDLCGFYDNLNQVIFLTKYNITNDENYFEERKNLINNVLKVAQNNGLKRTEDSIEDYGEHFYFVTRCSKEWIE
ncbi:hypothetical protein [uncultured Clostridium sp.]|uniref:hypothetical protein n=1 Tax=uncultured Clostridium sp. TaxID=59620 RepID=UPI0032171955